MDHNNPAGQELPPARAAAALACFNPQCATQIASLQTEIARLHEQIQALQEQIQELQRQRLRLIEPTVRKRGSERTWPDVLRRHLSNAAGGMPYAGIVRLCCREENMSQITRWTHPALHLAAPGERDAAPAPPATATLREQQHSGDPFPFEQLPITIQIKVLSLILHKKGELIHCCSRLDPFVAPDSFPSDEQLGTSRSGLPKRFVFGDGECNLTRNGVKPGDLLSVLLVNKRFCFLGAHIFFSLNSFSFSSLGELGRFCQGSGLARVARLQHVELLLTGSQYLVAPPAMAPKNPREWNASFSRRSYPLTWFGDMFRLKTLAVHVNETSSQYIRRKREHPDIKAFLRARTAGQPNRRDSRNLRCLQGLDYIYQLRSLDRIRFYDFEKSLKAGKDVRAPIQDWSFAEELARITTQPKPYKRLDHARLENLPPIFSGDPAWTPTEEDRLAVEALFSSHNGRCSYDELLKTRRNLCDADLGSYLGAPSRNDDIYSESGNSTGSSPDSDSSSSDSHSSGGDDEAPAARRRRPAQPQRRRRRRNSLQTQSSLFGSRAGSAPLDTDTDAISDSTSNAADVDTDSSSSSTADATAADSHSDSDSDSDSSASSSLFFNRPGSSRDSAIDLDSDSDDEPAGPDSGPYNSSAAAARASTGLFVTPGPGQQHEFAEGGGGVKREGTAGSGRDCKDNVITDGGTDVVDLTGVDSEDEGRGADGRKKLRPLRALFGGEDSEESDSDGSDDEGSLDSDSEGSSDEDKGEEGLEVDSDSDGEDGGDGGLGVKRAASGVAGREFGSKRARFGS